MPEAKPYKKQSQEAVAYQTSPKGAQMCARCSMYIKPKDKEAPACTEVVGPIVAGGWCKIFDWRKASA